VWRLPECRTPAGKILLEKMFLEVIPDRTLPAGAVPARLLRSGEYSIRGTFDLIRKSSLYWFADALEHGSLQGYRSHMPEFLPRLMEVYG